MRATITTTIETPMCCKELAAALSVSVHFVYKMRSAGFRMTWNADLRCEAATATEARHWMKQTNFRVVRGYAKKNGKQSNV